ncbi:MAG: TetR/AcrR family transcriptional regulator [Myxococcota bacterium]
MADTKDRILDAAGPLLAERGFEGTSLRAVTSRAGVNLAAVHYHFGSKLELLRAAVERDLAPVNQERLRRLSQLERNAAPGAPSVEDILRAMVVPGLQSQDVLHGAAASLLFTEREEVVGPLVRELFGELSERFVAALERALPELEPREIALRFSFGIGSLLHVLSGRFSLSPPIATLDPVPTPAELGDRLVHFFAAGLLARGDA